MGWLKFQRGNFIRYISRSDGTAWAVGHNGYGRLGDGTTTQRSNPVQVVHNS